MLIYPSRFPPKGTQIRTDHWQTANHLGKLGSVINHHQAMKIRHLGTTGIQWLINVLLEHQHNLQEILEIDVQIS